ncbi:type II secretion system F family protein [Arvimicrobium flavum]|uniref:type II secretion system F family protein n=1 Tax=Arvimicrobium flavum TaxID=3393320 RepID=UPI00237C40C5|nr:type II secretion system F family protein [Mesorhizobium shangrilense]
METLVALVSSSAASTLMLPIAVLMLLAGGVVLAWPLLAGGEARNEVKRRLKLEEIKAAAKAEPTPEKSGAAMVHERALKTTQEFYSKSDPENVARLRMKLIQAGYMNPNAVGNYFLIRFAMFFGLALAAFLLERWLGRDASTMSRWTFVVMAGGAGYFATGLVLAGRIRSKVREYRNGFPDFMDLMIVCSDAGMSMEAGIERVSKELALTYPSLSQNLQLVSLELRAGRRLDDALRSLSERLNLDEVRSFATLLQQSRELGTSLSGALRVFSDEMRHKRMSLAEEKAHALPAKMSVPVTVCILPVVLMIAIIPIIVKLNMLE